MITSKHSSGDLRGKLMVHPPHSSRVQVVNLRSTPAAKTWAFSSGWIAAGSGRRERRQREGAMTLIPSTRSSFAGPSTHLQPFRSRPVSKSFFQTGKRKRVTTLAWGPSGASNPWSGCWLSCSVSPHLPLSTNCQSGSPCCRVHLLACIRCLHPSSVGSRPFSWKDLL